MKEVKLPKLYRNKMNITTPFSTEVAENTLPPKNFNQWTPVGDGNFAPAHATIQRLDSGLYEPFYDNRLNDWTMMKLAINTDELYQLPTREIKEILEDIQRFWENRPKYAKYNLLHKRGILLYGDPGCGKSGIIQMCTKYLIEEQDGIIVNIKDADALLGHLELVAKFRQIEPDRPLIVILEDIESIASDNHATSKLLNLLDGVTQIENVVYIATTNYPEKLAERVTNRPSRFDRRYQVLPPSQEVRKAYLENKLKGETDIDIDRWVKDTEGMSLAHLKEVFISVKVLGVPYEEALGHLSEMKKRPLSKKASSIGFRE